MEASSFGRGKLNYRQATAWLRAILDPHPIGETTLRRWVSHGHRVRKLPIHRVGSGVLIDKRELLEFAGLPEEVIAVPVPDEAALRVWRLQRKGASRG